MNHQPHRTRHIDHQPHQRSDIHDQHRILDLDAEVFGDHLAAVLDLIGMPSARRVVDLGAGTGAGSRLLRERYPDAAMTCVDNDPQMLELLREQGFAVVAANLDEGFPALAGSSVTADEVAEAPADLVWASSSLHHVAHPARLLAGVRRALAPGGVLLVVELAALPRFLSHPRGALLEKRCHAAATAEGWNHHPNWTPGYRGRRIQRHPVRGVDHRTRDPGCAGVRPAVVRPLLASGRPDRGRPRLRERTAAAVPRPRRAGTPCHPDRLGGHAQPEPGTALSQRAPVFIGVG